MINIDDRILSKLDDSELWLIVHLAKRMGKEGHCWPSNKALLRETRWHIEKLQRVKKSLSDKRFLETTFRKNEAGQTSNFYRLTTRMIGVFVGVDQFEMFESDVSTPIGKTDKGTPIGKTTPTPPGKTDNEVLTNEVLINYTDSKESAFEKAIRETAEQSQKVPLTEEEGHPVKKKKERKKKYADPHYEPFVALWCRYYPDLGFDDISGKKIKRIIAKTITNRKLAGRVDDTVEQTCGAFEYVLQYVKRVNHWIHGKDIQTFESKYLSVIFEIKQGLPTNGKFTSKATNARDFVSNLKADR